MRERELRGKGDERASDTADALIHIGFFFLGGKGNFFPYVAVVCLGGPNGEMAMSIFEILGKNFGNELLRPCMDTLIPWPWVGREGRRVGNVLCDLVMYDGTPDLTSPRQLLKAQLDALRDRHCLVFKSAFEYEFKVMKEGTTEYLGGPENDAMNTRIWDENFDLFCDLTDTLLEMGVEVSTLMQEESPGQWEITTDPQEGVHGGDVAFYVKNAVKGFFKTRGYHATFMTRPRVDHIATGLHVNHSLWIADSEGQKSVMQDKTGPDQISSTARHWLAGILTHAPAITALCCPTLNCYRRLFGLASPGKITWGVDNRNALVRVRNSQDNVFFENCLPSGSCCPYLALAATVAAGLDGLDRKLECPPPMDVDKAGDLPKTLAQALDALEKDEQLCSLLGDHFVSCYTRSKREYEVQAYERAGLKSEEKKVDFERKMYLKNL